MNNTNKKNINNSELNMIDIKTIKKEAKIEELVVTNAEPELEKQQEVTNEARYCI